jgi:hypothetical protein
MGRRHSWRATPHNAGGEMSTRIDPSARCQCRGLSVVVPESGSYGPICHVLSVDGDSLSLARRRQVRGQGTVS